MGHECGMPKKWIWIFRVTSAERNAGKPQRSGAREAGSSEGGEARWTQTPLEKLGRLRVRWRQTVDVHVSVWHTSCDGRRVGIRVVMVKQHFKFRARAEKQRTRASLVKYAGNPQRAGSQSREEGRGEGKVRKDFKCQDHKFNTFPLCERKGRQVI